MKQNIPLILGAINIKDKKIHSYKHKEKVIYAYKNISEAITNCIILGDIMQTSEKSLEGTILQLFADAHEIIPSLDASVSMTYDVMLEILKGKIKKINEEASRLYAELLKDTDNDKKMQPITASALEDFFKKRIEYYMEISAMYVSDLEFAAIVDDFLQYEKVKKMLGEAVDQDTQDTKETQETIEEKEEEEEETTKDNQDKNKTKDTEENSNKSKRFYSEINKNLFNKIVKFLEPYVEEFIEKLGDQKKLYESKNRAFYIGIVDKIILNIITDNTGEIGKKQEERIKKFIQEQQKIMEKTQKEIEKAQKMGVTPEKYRKLKKIEEEETSFIGDVVENVMSFLRDKVGIKPPGFFKPLDFVFDRLVLNPMLKKMGTTKDIKRIKRLRQILGYDTKQLERAEKYLREKEDEYKRENNKCYSEMIKNLFGSDVSFDKLTEEQKSHIKILCYMRNQFQKSYKKDETLEKIKEMYQKQQEEKQQDGQEQQTDNESKKDDKLSEGLNKINQKNKRGTESTDKGGERGSDKKEKFDFAKKLNKNNIFLKN